MWNFAKLSVVALILKAVVSQECDSSTGWEEFGDYCFRLSRSAPETQYTWQEAREACLAEGGDLASIQSQQEQVHIVSMALEAGLVGFDLWMGMNQLEQRSGPFSWSDGSAVGYTFWAVDMPMTGGLTHCGYTMTQEGASGFTRHDYYNSVYGILYYPWEADGINTFFFGQGYQFDQNWCEEQCERNERCAAYSWFPYHWDYNWQYACVGRSDFWPVLEYDSYANSGVRSLSGSGGWWYSVNCGVNKAFACKKAKGSDTPITVPPTVSVDGYCPEGYFSADAGMLGKGSNKCFRIVSIDIEATGLRWEQALLLCRNGPGIWPDLASISSAEENAILAAQLKEIGWGHWIGLHHADREDKFVWSDNSEASFINFGPGEPQGSDVCVEMWTSPGPAGTWNNNNCASQRGYICQTYKDVANPIPTGPSVTPSTCPEGWLPYWYACYKVDTEARTYQGAVDNCASLGGSLVSIHSDAENSAVFAGASSQGSLPIWIGLQKNSESGVYEWEDGWPLSYFRFEVNATSSEGCVAMKADGTWTDTVCGNTYASVCKQTDYPTPTIPQATGGYCPRGNWVQWGNRCYYFSTETKTIGDAAVDCSTKAGTDYQSGLVSIESYLENDFIMRRMQSSSVWTGLRRVPGTADEFYWLDGTTYGFNYWAPGEPSDPINEQCVEIFADNWRGMWNDCACDYDYKYYICESTLGPSPTYPAVPTAAPGECPSIEWVKYENECLLFRPVDYRTWSDALEICKLLTGGRASLATIHSPEKNNIVFTNAYARIPPEQDYYAPHSWIGLSKQGYGYPYVWENEANLNFTNWAPGEPNDLDGTHNCVRMYVSDYYVGLDYLGKWDDYVCGGDYEYLGYVCQIPQGSYLESDFPEAGRKGTVYESRKKTLENLHQHKPHKKHEVHPDYLKHRKLHPEDKKLPVDKQPDLVAEDSPNEEHAKVQQVVAIVLGSVVGLLLTLSLIALVFIKKRRQSLAQQPTFNNPIAEEVSTQF